MTFKWIFHYKQTEKLRKEAVVIENNEQNVKLAISSSTQWKWVMEDYGIIVVGTLLCADHFP